jgi:hypothetical protein
LKKILIVAPFYPPSALPPSLRVRLLVNHLKEFGYEPIVITVNQKYREDKPDNWLVENTRRDFKIIEVKALNQKWTRKLGVGDLGIRMLPFLFIELIKICIKEKPAIILFPVPPWFILLTGPIIKFLFKIPYIIDFIDPWYYEITEELRNKNIKFKVNRFLAKILEGFVVRNANSMIAVSQGMLNDIVKRHPETKALYSKEIPYGIEQDDFFKMQIRSDKSEKIKVRFIGALNKDFYPVLYEFFNGVKMISRADFIIEFIGTNYAPENLSKPFLKNQIEYFDLAQKVFEYHIRITYKESIEKTINSDILLMFGSIRPYYTASKLLFLLASQKPFFAMVHADSFPAKFLSELHYPYLVTYTLTTDNKIETKQNVHDVLKELLDNYNNFKVIDFELTHLKEFTGLGMTKKFADIFNLI